MSIKNYAIYQDLVELFTTIGNKLGLKADKADLGTAAGLDVATSGNAGNNQVVKGNDTRLTDSRNAADVYSWAKAASKPSYTASEVGAIPTSAKGANNGVATLGSDGKVPSSQLPSYVDDVLEYASLSAFPATGESGKIYVALDTNKTYRWSGTAYVEISESLALGETSSTAYPGDKGKAAYEHSQLNSGNPHNVTKSDVGLSNVPNVSTNNQTPTFTQASSRANIASGEKLSVIFGKIMKWFADLGDLAFLSKNASTSNFLRGDGTWVTPTDTKNTAGSSDTSSKIFLIGATSQGANPQTYSDNEVFAQNGVLSSKKLSPKCITALTGTGTAGQDKGSGSTNRYVPALWTFNSGITVADGEIYFIKIPVAGGSYGVYLSLNNGTNYYPVAINNTKARFQTNYAKDTVIAVTYESGGVCNCYARTGADSRTDVTGCFRVLNDYDTTYSTITTAEINAGTSSSNRVVTPAILNSGINTLISKKVFYLIRTDVEVRYANYIVRIPASGSDDRITIDSVIIPMIDTDIDNPELYTYEIAYAYTGYARIYLKNKNAYTGNKTYGVVVIKN